MTKTKSGTTNTIKIMSEQISQIRVEAIIHAPVEFVWECWTNPVHIVHWNFASNDWHCPFASNDLIPGGKFSWRMEAKDGSMGFDYSGTYERIETLKHIEKKLDDGRKVSLTFNEMDGVTRLIERFEPDENDLDLQKQGWQAILDNFKNYVETK